ncbi:MAG: hypothetical protein HY678_02535 [Chloroflexi bacterium]|nr:hypothetical protein [Chloroflexota bacterium]
MTTLALLSWIPSRRDRAWSPSAEIIRDIFTECFPGSVTVLDITYGEGNCWTWPWQATGITLTTADRYVAGADHAWDFQALPCADESFDVVLFDPPHTSMGCDEAGEAHRYGVCRIHGGPRNTAEVRVSEAIRVARRGVIIKFKSCVEWGVPGDHWPSVYALIAARGWTVVDEWRKHGARPQPKSRKYVNVPEPCRYVVVVPAEVFKT